jgi:hypothetical protein
VNLLLTSKTMGVGGMARTVVAMADAALYGQRDRRAGVTVSEATSEESLSQVSAEWAERIRTEFQPMWGTVSPSGNRTMRPGNTPRHSCVPPSSETSNSACIPMQTPRKGRPDAMYSRSG